jgi:hypothetical protein
MSYAPDWSDEQRAEWKRDYDAGKPVLLPHPEHEPGECDHCDLLRQLMKESDDD